MATLKGFPARFKDTKAEDCTGEGWLEHFTNARKLIKQGGIAVFVGDCGTGKTRMSYELAKLHKERTEYVYGLNKICPAIYTTADKMLEALRSSYSGDNDAKSERNVTEEFCTASLLVIDELDACVKSEFGQRKLKRIIDERYMANLPTIMITNHDKNKLYELLPPPVISRIRENGKGFSFDWASFRDLVCQ
jgi:DNA replication protein DnaC